MTKGEDWNVLLHLVLSSWSSAIAMKRLRPDSLLVSEEFKGMCSRPHPSESWSQTQRTPPKCQTSHNCINEKWCSLLEAMKWDGFLIKIIVSIAHSLGCHVKKLIYRKSKWGILSDIFKRGLAEYLNFYWQETDWKNVFMPRRAHFSMSSLTQIRKDDGRWGILELRPIENNGLRNHSQEILWGCNQKHSQYSGRKTEQHLLSRISEFLD